MITDLQIQKVPFWVILTWRLIAIDWVSSPFSWYLVGKGKQHPQKSQKKLNSNLWYPPTCSPSVCVCVFSYVLWLGVKFQTPKQAPPTPVGVPRSKDTMPPTSEGQAQESKVAEPGDIKTCGTQLHQPNPEKKQKKKTRIACCFIQEKQHETTSIHWYNI